jgi:predicted nucleotidyltransferase component of viral defense system
LITNDEILAKANEFGIHTSNVQRDYVFGWLIAGVYAGSPLGERVALKGGNALRKGYFPATRFSDDLDFTTEQGLDPDWLISQFNEVCRLAQARSGVRFDLERNQVHGVHTVDQERRVYQLRLYFQDFSGNADHITLKVRVDVAAYDRLVLPLVERHLIHQYSDAAECSTPIRCIALEEALADKLKCLLQRRYSHDLFDLVYAIVVNRELDVDRRQLVGTFLRKTIFEPSPSTARRLLMAVPFELMRGFWDRLICPQASRLSFDGAVTAVLDLFQSLFEPFAYGDEMARAYFPAELRNPILEAGANLTLLRMTYDGVARLIEPYSLAFKKPQGRPPREYFYAYDQTGGRSSGPDLKSFVNERVQHIENTEERFEPRYEVELAKAGDRAAGENFARPFSAQRRGGVARRGRVRGTAAQLMVYVIRCSYCGKSFRRSKPSTRLNPHKDGYGNRCFGRIGTLAY